MEMGVIQTPCYAYEVSGNLFRGLASIEILSHCTLENHAVRSAASTVQSVLHPAVVHLAGTGARTGNNGARSLRLASSLA